jgi:hypothetical protein
MFAKGNTAIECGGGLKLGAATLSVRDVAFDAMPTSTLRFESTNRLATK